MPVYKNQKRNSWFVSFYYTDWLGKRKKKKKEGFLTKRDALNYERNFLEIVSKQCTIHFKLLVNTYLDDCKKRTKFSTYTTKYTVIKKHILPFFTDKPINEIKAENIRQWQLWLFQEQQNKSNQYLHYINTQLSCIFNFARKYYGLDINPVKQCNIIGNTKSKEKNFWTLNNFNDFIQKIDKHDPLYIIYNILFWTGIRRGELLALRPMDFDFKQKQLIIRRNLVYIKNKPQINTPKTQTSWRRISVPNFLLDIINCYIKTAKIDNTQLLFNHLPRHIRKGIAIYSVKANLSPIKIHDFRHSHASLLIEKGYSPMIIAERLGHKNINTTLKIYAHIYPNKQQKLACDLDDLYKSSKNSTF